MTCFFRKWTIQRRVQAITASSLLLSLCGLGAAGGALQSLMGKLEQVVITTDALRYHLHADMMHDALRGDVLSAMLGQTPAERAEVSKDISQHADLFRQDLRQISALPLPADLKSSLAAVEAELIQYVESAKDIVAAAAQGVDAARARMPQFNDRFEALEKKNDALSDQIQRSATNARIAAASLVRSAVWVIVGVVAGLILFGALSVFAVRGMLRILRDHLLGLSEGVTRVARIAAGIGASSRDVTAAASEQAESLDRTSSAGERIHELAKKNSDLSHIVADSVNATQVSITEANSQLVDSVSSMQAIRTSSAKISSINQIIESIAFQTNLLALNAAVEAARAGSVGAGFAVVADEVRALAQRCAEAARSTAELVEESIRNGVEGSEKVSRAAGTIQQITQDATQMKVLVDQVHTASTAQSAGVAEVARLISNMRNVNQRSAGTMDSTAAEAAQLSSEAAALSDAANHLLNISTSC